MNKFLESKTRSTFMGSTSKFFFDDRIERSNWVVSYQFCILVLDIVYQPSIYNCTLMYIKCRYSEESIADRILKEAFNKLTPQGFKLTPQQHGLGRLSGRCNPPGVPDALNHSTTQPQMQSPYWCRQVKVNVCCLDLIWPKVAGS